MKRVQAKLGAYSHPGLAQSIEGFDLERLADPVMPHHEEHRSEGAQSDEKCSDEPDVFSRLASKGVEEQHRTGQYPELCPGELLIVSGPDSDERSDHEDSERNIEYRAMKREPSDREAS